MADQKITQLTADTAPTNDDLVVTVNDPSGTPANRKVTLANLAQAVGGAWSSYSPTLTNITIGNGSSSFAYNQIGKQITVRGIITLGSTSSIGTGPTISLPTTSIATPNALFPMGIFIYDNNGGSGYNGYMGWASTTTAKFYIWDTNNNLGQVTATNPVAFGANHKLYVNIVYETS